MPEIQPTGAPWPRSVLGWDGTNWRVMAVDLLGHVQVDVVTSGLPAGAATAANQATMITALQLIDDLRDALESVATDRLQVRGEDQLFSYREKLQLRDSDNPSGANGYLELGPVPAGEIWVVTLSGGRDNTRALTSISWAVRTGVAVVVYGGLTRAIAANEYVFWLGNIFLEENDHIRAYYIGSAAGDTVELTVFGYIMTLEV